MTGRDPGAVTQRALLSAGRGERAQVFWGTEGQRWAELLSAVLEFCDYWSWKSIMKLIPFECHLCCFPCVTFAFVLSLGVSERRGEAM